MWFKNSSYIFKYSRWDNSGNSKSNLMIGSYSANSKIFRIFFIRYRLILSLLILITTIVLDMVILTLDIIKHILDIITLYNNNKKPVNFFFQTSKIINNIIRLFSYCYYDVYNWRLFFEHCARYIEADVAIDKPFLTKYLVYY